ncbi:MAG TPA: GIY-YIG nuclease family protein [Bacillota bacterium]|nr:GIY-YIG nuclease family protein [Bacillota bacterium]
MYFVYMLRCRDHSIYTGITNNLDRRIYEHNQGKASKYTRVRLPVQLVYVEPIGTKSDALKREIELKKLKKKQKEQKVLDYSEMGKPK